MPLEKSIVKAIIQLLKARGAWYVKYHGHRAGRAGVPDILACFRGRFIAIEVKQPTGRTTKLQDMELAALERAGAVTVIATSKEQVEEVLDMLAAA